MRHRDADVSQVLLGLGFRKRARDTRDTRDSEWSGKAAGFFFVLQSIFTLTILATGIFGMSEPCCKRLQLTSSHAGRMSLPRDSDSNVKIADRYQKHWRITMGFLAAGAVLSLGCSPLTRFYMELFADKSNRSLAWASCHQICIATSPSASASRRS